MKEIIVTETNSSVRAQRLASQAIVAAPVVNNKVSVEVGVKQENDVYFVYCVIPERIEDSVSLKLARESKATALKVFQYVVDRLKSCGATVQESKRV